MGKLVCPCIKAIDHTGKLRLAEGVESNVRRRGVNEYPEPAPARWGPRTGTLLDLRRSALLRPAGDPGLGEEGGDKGQGGGDGAEAEAFAEVGGSADGAAGD